MRKLYIIDEAVSSKKNGIGTYIKELTSCLRDSVDIHVISFNSEVREFTMTCKEGITAMDFPEFPSGIFTRHGTIVRFLLQLHIQDEEENVFLVNHSPCSDFIAAVKEGFPKSAVWFVIHDLGWTTHLLGDVHAYTDIIHNRTEEENREKYAFLIERYEEEKKIYQQADAVICLSTETERIVRKLYGIGKEKVFLIPNGAEDKRSQGDKEEVRRKLKISSHERLLIFAGRLAPLKGVQILLKSFEKVLADYPDSRLIIAGSDSGNRLEHLISAYSHIGCRLTFTGYLDKETLRDWYAAADVGVIPSYAEQCSYTGIEMLMNGLPIAATDGYSLPDMFQDNCNARVAHIESRADETKTVENLANAICSLLASAELCRKLSGQARRTYEEKYAARYMKQMYLALMNKSL